MIAGFRGYLVTPSYIARRCVIRDREIESRWRAVTSVCAAVRAELGPASSVRRLFEVALAPLAEALGFDTPAAVDVRSEYAAASIHTGDRSIRLVALPWAEPLDRAWRMVSLEGQHHAADWVVVGNGVQLRVVDASRLYGRRYVECDLQVVIDRLETFAGLFHVVGGMALFAGPDDPRSLHAMAAESDREAAAVCRSLRDGVTAAAVEVLGALVRGMGRSTHGTSDAFEQALTIVYRIVFLLFSEARALVPIWHPVYRDSYSVEALREISEGTSRARGLWDTLRAMSRLAHAGCTAGDLHVTPFNGRLFAPARTPLAERRGLDDEAVRRAVLALSTRPAADRAGRERIVYRELGVEQLGAVYETLLDYQPRVVEEPRAPGRTRTTLKVSLEPGSGLRKATGSFYTPQAIAEYLVRRTLGPLVRHASAEAILQLRIVDPAMGSGAILIAACRYLGAAYERALIDAGVHHAGDFGDAERTAVRRLVAERCLYGVDLNPMAVQLARLSLWLTTLAADRPLSFLDHRLVAGDSLIGAWLHQLKHAPVRRRHRTNAAEMPLFADEFLSTAMSAALPIRFSFEQTPNDTIEQVRAKERALGALTADTSALSRWKQVADLWCATWFGSSDTDVPAEAFQALADTVLAGDGALPSQMSRTYLERARQIARRRRFFHWELEFPEAFFEPSGQRRPSPGFDAVIGNPPWDMMRADGAREPNPGAQARMRADIAAAVRFTRDAGAYHGCGSGHANRYQLFLERAMALTRAGGRIGLVLPSGLATDHGSAALRRELISRCDVDAIVGVDNVRAIFPIHRSMRFVLATATAGRPTLRFGCRFGVETAAELQALAGEDGDGGELPIELTPVALERLSGSSITIPHLRRRLDLDIAEKAAALFPPVGSSDGWSASFSRELNATDDRKVFQPPGVGWPVLDGRHLEPFRSRAADATKSIRATEARRLLGGGRIDRPRLAYRDVASATNRTTLISAILPPRTVTTHTVFCLRTRLSLRDQHTLCGFFNSLVVNYLVRQRVTTHVTTAMVERLPIPTRSHAPAACRQIGALARLLALRWNEERFSVLNACVAQLYQLTADEFAHVLSTFPLIPKESRTRMLDSFREHKC